MGRNTGRTISRLRILVTRATVASDSIARDPRFSGFSGDTRTTAYNEAMADVVALNHALAYIAHHQRHHANCDRPIREKKGTTT